MIDKNQIPRNPDLIYDDWISWSNLLGHEYISTRKRKFRDFASAREFVRSLKLDGEEAWREYYQSDQRPDDIPTTPSRVYPEWAGMGDWLGTGNIATYNRDYLDFGAAREFIHKLGLKNQAEWRKYSKSDKPNNIPSAPWIVYAKDWKGMGDWIGTGNRRGIGFRSFEAARTFVRDLKLKNESEWRKYCKSGEKPLDIPATPSRRYKEKWKGMGDWLGTGAVAPNERQYRSFSEARKFVRSFSLKDEDEWREFSKTKRPLDIPSAPWSVYRNEWKGMKDWLGTK